MSGRTGNFAEIPVGKMPAKLMRCDKWGYRMIFKKKKQSNQIEFDPTKQYGVIRSSICSGEKVAGFKDIEGGHFTEVMLIRNKADEEKFKKMYNLESVKTEY